MMIKQIMTKTHDRGFPAGCIGCMEELKISSEMLCGKTRFMGNTMLLPDSTIEFNYYDYVDLEAKSDKNEGK
jgi:hypothetical protein